MARTTEAVRKLDERVERGLLAFVLPWGYIVGVLAVVILPIPAARSPARTTVHEFLDYGTVLAGIAAVAALTPKFVPGAGRRSFLRRLVAAVCGLVAAELALHALEWLGVGSIALKQLASDPITIREHVWVAVNRTIGLAVPISILFAVTYAALGAPRRPYGRGGLSSSPASSPPMS